MKWKRFAEPMVYMFIFSTIAMTLPFAFRCRESGCFIDAGAAACRCNRGVRKLTGAASRPRRGHH